MSRMTRRSLLKLGLMGTGTVVLIACAPKVAPAPVEEKPAAPAEPAVKAPAEKIQLRFITRQGDHGMHHREFANRYAAESEGRIEVECEEVAWGEIPTRIETQMVAGILADAAVQDNAWFPYLTKRGAWLDLDPFIDKHQMDLSEWFNVEWWRKWSDNKITGIGGGAGLNHIITWYNREWVLEAWGKEPWDDWTMDDYAECMEACVKLKGEGFFGGDAPVGGGHVADGWVQNWGGGYMNPEGTECRFNDPKTQDGIKFHREQLANGNYPGREDRAEGIGHMFFAETLAIRVDNPGAATGMAKGAEELGIDLGVCLAPKGPSAFENPPRRGFSPYTNMKCASRTTKYPEEAFLLVKKVCSTESMLWLFHQIGKQPGGEFAVWRHPDVVADFPIFAKVADLMEETQEPFPMPANVRDRELRDVAGNEIPPLVFGEVEYNQANIDRVHRNMQEIIDLPPPS